MISTDMFSLVTISEKQSLKMRVAANKAKNGTKKAVLKFSAPACDIEMQTGCAPTNKDAAI